MYPRKTLQPLTFVALAFVLSACSPSQAPPQVTAVKGSSADSSSGPAASTTHNADTAIRSGITADSAKEFGWDLNANKPEPGSRTTRADIDELNSRLENLQKDGLLKYFTLDDPRAVDVNQLYAGWAAAFGKAYADRRPDIAKSFGLNIARTDITALDPATTVSNFDDTGAALANGVGAWLKAAGSTTPRIKLVFKPLQSSTPNSRLILQSAKGANVDLGDLWKKPAIIRGANGNISSINVGDQSQFFSASGGELNAAHAAADQWVVLSEINGSTGKKIYVAMLLNSYGAEMMPNS